MKDNLHEVWKDIPGFFGYSVSSLGRVYSKRTSVRGKHGFRCAKPKLLKPFYSGQNMNYLSVVLSLDGKVFRRKVHSLVMLAFCGERPECNDVDHIDGNTQNNNLRNLRYLHRSLNRGRRCNG